MVNVFAAQVRQHRLRRRLTQEVLAELAGISSRSLRELERGRPCRPATVERLATALGIGGEERVAFVRDGLDLYWASRRGDSAGADRRDGDPPRHRQLPRDLPDFVGREEQLQAMRAALDPGPGQAAVVVVSGPPGVGKSALAVHCAHRMAACFPDGQLFARLRNGRGDPVDPADVLAQLLQSLEVPRAGVPSTAEGKAALFRARMADRRILLLLDDAHSHAQVEALLPAHGAAVLVTSRLSLTALPGMCAIDLRPMEPQIAVQLLARVAGDERVGREPAAANDLVDLCGGLPLAVRIAAARLTAHPTWTVARFTRQLADEGRRLDELSHGDQAVRPTLALAYQGLKPRAAEAFLLLGAIGAPSFPEWSISSFLGVTREVAANILRELLDARLLDELGQDSAGQLRYRLHHLTALFARERSVLDMTPDARLAAMTRAGKAWHAVASQARDRLHCQRMMLDEPPATDAVPDAETVQLATAEPIAWFEAERETITALVDATASAGLATIARQLAGCVADFHSLRGHVSDWHRCMRGALAACHDADDAFGEAVMLRGLGICLIELDDLEGAASTLSTARELALATGDRRGAALAAKEHGFVLALSGRLAEAEERLLATVPQLTGGQLRQAAAITLSNLAFVRRQQGQLDAAVRDARAALVAARSCGDRFAEAYACRGLAGALIQSGRLRPAQRVARRAVASFEAIGDPIGAGQSLRALGEALAGEPERSLEARRALLAAAAIFRDRGFVWGFHLAELSLAELELSRDGQTCVERLERCLQYWTQEKVPALRARTLVALATAAEGRDGSEARRLLTKAYHLYRRLDLPAAASIAIRLQSPTLPTSPLAGGPMGRSPRLGEV